MLTKIGYHKRLHSCNIWLFAALAFVIIIGCTKNFDEINTPENVLNADKISTSLIGPAFAESQYFGLLAGDFFRSQTQTSNVWVQYFTTTKQGFNSDQFLETGAWTNSFWTAYYGGAAPQIYLVEKFTKENSMQLENAIAKVWKVEMYHRMTDYFGPIIYSQFGNQQTSVAYDSQEDIYTNFFLTLDSAVVVLQQNAGKNAFGTNDQIYKGNVDNWLKFANSLRLRLAIRLAYIAPELAQKEAEKAVAASVMINNTDNAYVISTVNSINWLSIWTYINEFRMSSSMESVLKGYEDPRISVYFAPAVNGGGFKGIRNGLPDASKGNFLNLNNSFVAKAWLPIASGGSNPPNRIMNASEVFFLRAEGALRGWIMNGTPAELYNSGIRMSMTETTTAPSAQIENYIISINTPIALQDDWHTPAMSDIPVRYDVSGSFERQLEQIITQKWIALYPDGWEAWAERRRTGYPKGYRIINSLNPDVPVDQLMRRYTFTTGEISSNSVAVEAARTLLKGPDKNNTRVWWDAKPLTLFPNL